MVITINTELEWWLVIWKVVISNDALVSISYIESHA